MFPFQSNLWTQLVSAVQSRFTRFRLQDLLSDSSKTYKRAFHRHGIGDLPVATLRVNSKVLSVINLSYGGLRVAVDGDPKAFGKKGFMFEAELNVLGQSHPLHVCLRDFYKGAVGFSFEHLVADDEQFLAEFLYFMDAGFVLKSAPKQSISQPYRGPDWLSYSGLRGAVEVYLHMDGPNPASEAHICYVHNMRQDFVVFSTQNLMVACNPKRELQLREKQAILIHVICILIGLRQVGKTTKLDPLLKIALQRLQRSLRMGAVGS